MKSIIAELGDSNFKRIRIGVGKPTNEYMDLADFVLSKAKMTDELKMGIDKGADCVYDLVNVNTIDVVMQKYN